MSEQPPEQHARAASPTRRTSADASRTERGRSNRPATEAIEPTPPASPPPPPRASRWQPAQSWQPDQSLASPRHRRTAHRPRSRPSHPSRRHSRTALPHRSRPSRPSSRRRRTAHRRPSRPAAVRPAARTGNRRTGSRRTGRCPTASQRRTANRTPATASRRTAATRSPPGRPGRRSRWSWCPAIATFCCFGIPSLIIGIIALTKARTDIAEAKRLTKIGWIVFGVLAGVGLILTIIGAVNDGSDGSGGFNIDTMGPAGTTLASLVLRST